MKRVLVEIVAAIIVAVGGGLLLWGSSFAGNFVHDQLAEQKISFPPKGPALPSNLNDYAGQQVLDGDQAKAYADKFIHLHLTEVNDGKTYSETSTESRAKSTELEDATANGASADQIAKLTKEEAVLKGKTDTLFRGETLRGLLLYAWGWWLVGRIAFFVSLFLFLAAVVLLGAAFVTRPHHTGTSAQAPPASA